ncbi:hypothetical protein BH10PSE6_BH10PSE6_06600 [soil metagenome]
MKARGLEVTAGIDGDVAALGQARLFDPIAALEEIENDKADVTYAIELLLDRYAVKHGISHTGIHKAVRGYVSDLVGDVFFDLEEELRPQRDEAPEIG